MATACGLDRLSRSAAASSCPALPLHLHSTQRTLSVTFGIDVGWQRTGSVDRLSRSAAASSCPVLALHLHSKQQTARDLRRAQLLQLAVAASWAPARRESTVCRAVYSLTNTDLVSDRALPAHTCRLARMQQTSRGPTEPQLRCRRGRPQCPATPEGARCWHLVRMPPCKQACTLSAHWLFIMQARAAMQPSCVNRAVASAGCRLGGQRGGSLLTSAMPPVSASRERPSSCSRRQQAVQCLLAQGIFTFGRGLRARQLTCRQPLQRLQ